MARSIRPNGHLYWRPDAARWMKPERVLPSAYAGEVKYRPDQPRVPAGNPRGGQWTRDDETGFGGVNPLGSLMWLGGGVDEGSDVTTGTDHVGEIGDLTDLGAGLDAYASAEDDPKLPGRTPLQITIYRLPKDVPDEAGSSGNDDDALEPILVAGGSGRGGRFGRGDFPRATEADLIRLDLNIARTENAIELVRRYEPEWQPKTESLVTPGSVRGAIRDTEARAEEAEAYLFRLRTGIGGNLPPPEARLPPPPPVFDGPGWIRVYRAINNGPDMFGRPSWPIEDETVAVSRLGGRIYFGTSSLTPIYSALSDTLARQARDVMISKYPGIFKRGNDIGQKPNDAFFHAEVSILLRMANENGGTLRGQNIEVHVDRPVCHSCQVVLPYLVKELGGPTVTLIDNNGFVVVVPGQ